MTGPDAGVAAAEAASERLVVSLDGFEGPLDLMLALVRQQKLDLARIPILPLVDQYLRFIADARALRLDIAADHLVMAAWLAYLKSALLLPAAEAPQPDPGELAERLRWRLMRLGAMREAASRLLERDILGRDVLRRGAPEGLTTIERRHADASLYDLLRAYGALHGRRQAASWTPHDRGPVVTLEEALERLASMIGTAVSWTELSRFLPEGQDAALRRSAIASSLVAALELARTGRAELRQEASFGPLMLRARRAAD